MNSLALDTAMLVRFAGQSSFSWMASLRPIRIWQQVTPTKKCCGQKHGAVPVTVVQQVVNSPGFAADLAQLKQRMKIDKLIVNVHGYRTAV